MPTRGAGAGEGPNIVLLDSVRYHVQRLDTRPRQEKQRKYYAETVRSIVPLSAAHPWFADWYVTWQREFAHLAASAE